MELWIRSQDKKRLFRAENLYVDEFYQVVGYRTKEQKTVCGMAIWHNEKNIAKYETEQRCLEILDEIQKILTKTTLCYMQGSITQEEVDKIYANMYKDGCVCIPNGVKFANLDIDSFVYQMPEK